MLFATAKRVYIGLLLCLNWSLGQASVHQFVPQSNNSEVSIQSVSNTCCNTLGLAQSSNYINCFSPLQNFTMHHAPGMRVLTER